MTEKNLVFSRRRDKTFMKIAKKRRGLLASIALSALVLTGCTFEEGLASVKDFFDNNVISPISNLINGGGEQKPSGEDTPTPDPEPVVKKDVSITIAMEDGKQYNEGEFVAPAVSVNPSSLTPVISYYKGQQELGSEAPQSVGDYKIVAKTSETEEYKAGLASKSFLIRKVPTISFFYGEDNPLEVDHQFDLANGDYNIYAKSSVEGANFTYSYLDAQGARLSAKPQQEGTYYFVADVARTSTIGSASKSIRFEVVDSSSGVVTVDPVIKFFYKGEQACLESNWLIGGYAASHFDAADFDITQLTYTVDPANATYAETWSLKALDAPEEAEGEPIAKPTANPLAPGIYAVTITVSETKVAHSAVKWAGFVINDNGETPPTPGEKVKPTITYFYNGEEACLESNWLIGGYAASHFDAADFDINKLTYTVAPQGSPYTESWTLKALDAPEEAEGSPIAKPTANPLAPGIYTITVNVTEGEHNLAGFRWAGFVINDNGQTPPSPGEKVAPTITYFYNGEEACLESNWLNGGFAASHFDAADFDINKLTYTVSPADSPYTESWTLKALDAPEEAEGSPIAKPSNPLAPGIYTITVNVTEGAHNLEGFRWAGFVINDNGQTGQKVDPAIRFFYDGEEKCISGSNWLNEGYGDTQYLPSEFDISKLTYTVTPEATATASWTLNDQPIAAPSNPLASGTYALTISVEASDTVNAAVKWALFFIKEAPAGKVDPAIHFFYDGAEKCISGTNWLNEGYGDSQFDASEFDVSKLTYTVTPEASATATWTLNDQPIEAPSNPLAAGTYALTISVEASDTVNAAVKWALFAIKESAPEKQDPTIKFFYDGAEKCISGTRWLNEGYGDTQFYPNEFDVSKLTYTVTPEATVSVSWTLNEQPIEAPSNPLAAGTYALTVSVAASDTVNAGSAYALFAIKEAPTAQDPVIKFFYDGQEKCISGTRWLNEGFGDSQFEASEFDVSKLTYTVSPEATVSVSWTLDEKPIAAPSNPLAAGTYALTVAVEASATVNAGSAYALFAIKEAPTAQDPVIKFFYDGQEKCISGTRWLNEGFGDSQFEASEFDVSKLTYTVSPEATVSVSWTLDEKPIAAPSNPLAAGTYALTVAVEASATVNAGSAYALFAIKAPAEKVDPTIRFFYDGVEKCISGSHWLNEGYGDSQFESSEFDVSKLTFTVSPQLDAIVTWTLNDQPIAAPSNPLAAGTYALTVLVDEGENNNQAVHWALFAIKESTPAPSYKDATMTAGTNGSTCTVNNIDGIKVGTSKADGNMTITVPKGATEVKFYAVAWKGGAGNVNVAISNGTVSASSIDLTADDGLSNNSPFTLVATDLETFVQTVTLSGVESEATITISSGTARRFAVWGAQYK